MDHKKPLCFCKCWLFVPLSNISSMSCCDHLVDNLSIINVFLEVVFFNLY